MDAVLRRRRTRVDRCVLVLLVVVCLGATPVKALVLATDPVAQSRRLYQLGFERDAWGRPFEYQKNVLHGICWSVGVNGLDEGGDRGDDFVVGRDGCILSSASAAIHVVPFVAIGTLAAALTYAALRRIGRRSSWSEEIAVSAALALPGALGMAWLGFEWDLLWYGLIPWGHLDPVPLEARVACTLSALAWLSVFGVRRVLGGLDPPSDVAGR